MKLSNKIYIHYLTLALFFISFLTGYAKYVFFIFLIVMIHESGHIIFAKILKRKITKIEILPFGGLTKIDSLISENIFEDLLISVGGVFTQTIFGFYLKWLNNTFCISASTFEFLENFNITIIIFNLLPICPLDGYKILKLTMELFIPYNTTFKIGAIISTITLITLTIFKINLIKDNIFIFAFIIFTILEEIKNRKYLFNRFLLERLNHDFNFSIKNIKNYRHMFKNKVHFIKGIHEKILLQELFSRKTH